MDVETLLHMWYTQMLNSMAKSFKVPKSIMERFNDKVIFEGDQHNVLIIARVDPNHKYVFPLSITANDVKDIVIHWLAHL